MQYWSLVGCLWGLYAILAISLNLILGEMGLLSLCHAAFYGIGAYAFAILTTKASLSPYLATLLSISITGLSAIIIGIPLYRLRGDFFALATFGFALVVHGLFLNWVSLTGGGFGLVSSVSTLFPWLNENISIKLLFPIWLVLFILVAITRRWQRSPLGRVINAIREDEELALSVGKPVKFHRLTAFSIGGVVAGTTGIIYFILIGVVDPGGFDFMESVMLVAMVIIGGAGSSFGAITGAGIVVLLPEILRFCGINGPNAGNIKQVIFGLLLFLMLFFRPKGLFGRLGIGVEKRV